MTDCGAVLDRIKTHIYLRNIMPIEWFRDFDKLRSGKVTREQFRRCFENMKFEITASEFEAVANEFAVGDLVNYQDFINAIQSIYSNIDLEKHPKDTVADPKEIITRTLGSVENVSDPKLDALMRKLTKQVQTRGVHIREAYQDFDRHNSGNVTKTQFLRALPFIDLSNEEIQALVDRYSDPKLGDVNYRRMIIDVNKYAAMSSAAATSTFLPHQLGSIKTRSFDLEPSTLLQKLSAHIREHRIRTIDFFHAHDQLNKGLITRQKFESSLSQFNFPLTQHDLDFLSNRYEQVVASTVYIRYIDFCREIESIPPPTTSQSNTEKAAPILAKIREIINKYRINALPTFQDFDRNGRGTITKSQFYRTLSTLRISITPAELDVLAEVYERNDDVDYFRFIEDVDSQHSQRRRSFQPVGTTKQSIEEVYGKTPTGDRFVTQDEADQMIYTSKRGLLSKLDEKSEFDTLFNDIARWSSINSVHFHEFLADFDKFNCGEIPIPKFRSGLSMAGYLISENEFDTLCTAYASPTRDGFVQWKKFADEVRQANPVRQTQIVTRGNPEEMPQNIKQLVENIARFVKSRRIAILEQFKDKDKHNHKRVSASAFAQVIQLIGVHVSKNEIDMLCGYYNDPKTNFVEYSRFVQDVDAFTGRIFGDRAQDSIVINPIPSYSKEDSPYLISRLSNDGYVESWEETLRRLQTYVFKRRIRINEFFLSFDNLRRGKVSTQKFRSVVGQTGLPLTAEQIDAVIQRFGDGDLFDYRSFCNEVNQISYVDDALPDPSSTLQSLDDAHQQALQKILERMRNMVLTRRMNIREQFEDYDKTPHKNYITKQQFKQCIARLGLTTDPKEFDVLCKRYRCTELDDMNYQAFCHDIE